MTELDIAQIERKLAVVISESRRKAISYTVLTILCTPAFVLLGSLVMMLLLVIILRFADYEINARGIYTGFNIFLGYMVIFVLRCSNPSDEPHPFDKAWLAAVIVFILPLSLPYITGLPDQSPLLFAIVYAGLAFFVMGLLGHVQIGQPTRDKAERENALLSFILVVSSFIATSYGEIIRYSWLWFPPKPEEVRLGAWILCQLAIEKTMPLDSQSVPRRILNMLTRLKLVQVTDRKIHLTLKGGDLLKEAGENQGIAEE